MQMGHRHRVLLLLLQRKMPLRCHQRNQMGGCETHVSLASSHRR